ncbi:hypothetical protein D3C71_1028610 [compost metagenome]
MKLVAGDFKDYNPYTNKDEIKFVDLTLHCKNEEEFIETFKKIKDIDGVIWCGCPTIEDDGKYIDMVATVHRKNFDTNSEMFEQLKEIRIEIEQTLKIGKYRNK